MSTLAQVDHAVDVLGRENLMLMHTTSAYPAKVADLNLRMIPVLREPYGIPVGYSGHEVGLPTTVAAVALGACYVERHLTLDRAMWGSDQAASVEPRGFARLVHYIRTVEAAMGDGLVGQRVDDSRAGLLLRPRPVLELVLALRRHFD